MPCVVEMETSTVPLRWAGATTNSFVVRVATIFVFVASAVPKLTSLTPVKCLPVMVTSVPPVVLPDDGVTEEIVGCGVMKV